MGGSNVVRVGTHATANNLRINFCTAGFCVLKAFENDGSRTFAGHKTVSVLVERPGCGSRVIVTGGQRMHCVESANPGFINDRFRTAGDDHIRKTGTNIVERIDQSVRRRSAGRNRGKIQAVQAISHGYMPGSNIQNHFRDEKRVEAWRAVAGSKTAYLVEKSLQTADARPPNHANAVGV